MAAPLELARRMLEIIPPSMHWIRTETRLAASSKLTVPQFRVLLNIYKGIRHVSQIAEHHGVSQPTMSKTVDLLVKRGLVERIPAENDRRQIFLKLTARGETLYRSVKEATQFNLSRRIASLSPEEQRQMLQGLLLVEKLYFLTLSDSEKPPRRRS